MDTKQIPRKNISVVMCTYNGEKYLAEQIDSILGQTYPAYELIIQDDGSTDKTADIVRAYQQKDKRVRLCVNPSPLGFNHNFSTAFAKAGGDYIASCDQDDIWREDKLEVLMRNVGKHALVFHNSCLFSTTPACVSGMKNASDVLYNELYLLLKPYVPGHECFFSRNILPLFMQAVEKEPRISYDSLLMVAASVQGSIAFVDEGLVYWRRHRQATSFGSGSRYGSTAAGLLSAFGTLRDKRRRETTRRYFQALEDYPFRTQEAAQVVRHMGKGNLYGLLRSCCICLRRHKELYPHAGFTRSCIKSFFTPLYFIRDCSKFAIH